MTFTKQERTAMQMLIVSNSKRYFISPFNHSEGMTIDGLHRFVDDVVMKKIEEALQSQREELKKKIEKLRKELCLDCPDNKCKCPEGTDSGCCYPITYLQKELFKDEK